MPAVRLSYSDTFSLAWQEAGWPIIMSNCPFIRHIVRIRPMENVTDYPRMTDKAVDQRFSSPMSCATSKLVMQKPAAVFGIAT